MLGWRICSFICLINLSLGQDIKPIDLNYSLTNIDSSNTTENINSVKQKLCALGYCDLLAVDQTEQKSASSNQLQRQFQITNIQDNLDTYGSNIDYSELTLDTPKQINVQDSYVPLQSTHIHHHFHHNANNNEQSHAEQPDYQGIRNAKNYAFQQQKIPLNIKRVPNIYYERPQQIPDFNSNYPRPLNKAPTNSKRTQFGTYNNIQQTQNINDCSCVPYQYCATEDVVGRRDDLVLPLDPRNIDKNIEAEQNSTKVDEPEEKRISKRDIDEKQLPDVEPVRFYFNIIVNILRLNLDIHFYYLVFLEN